jgi:hypothetical protein
MSAKKLGAPRVSLVTTPTYPIPGRVFRLRLDPVTNTGTHCRIWCTAAPLGTKLRKELDESRADRVVFQPLMPISTTGRPVEVDVTLEKGGGYVLQVQEILLGNPDFPNFTGGYENDPRGALGETVKNTGEIILYVAAPLSMQLGCGGDTATLKIYTHNQTVIQTELPVHGEATPRVDLATGATPRARLAAEAQGVRDAVTALAGQDTDDLVGDISGSLDNLLTKIRAHLVQSGRHVSNDTDNSIGTSFNGATTAPSRAATLSELRRLLGRHMRNDSGAGTGSAGYHSAADWTSLPLDAASPSDALTDGISHADVWRAYEAHRISAIHRAADNVNRADELPPLLELHRQFLIALAASSIAAPSTGQSGSSLLISQLGFKDA